MGQEGLQRGQQLGVMARVVVGQRRDGPVAQLLELGAITQQYADEQSVGLVLAARRASPRPPPSSASSSASRIASCSCAGSRRGAEMATAMPRPRNVAASPASLVHGGHRAQATHRPGRSHATRPPWRHDASGAMNASGASDAIALRPAPFAAPRGR